MHNLRNIFSGRVRAARFARSGAAYCFWYEFQAPARDALRIKSGFLSPPFLFFCILFSASGCYAFGGFSLGYFFTSIMQ